MVFSFFKKKQSEPVPAPARSADPTPAPGDRGGGAAVQRIVAGWDAFISSNQEQVERLLARAVAESEPLITGRNEEYQRLGHLWTKTEAEVRPFSGALATRWDAVCDELSDLSLPEEGATQREGKKRDTAHCEVDIAYQRSYRATMARAAEAVRRRALETSDAALKGLFTSTGALVLGQHAAQRPFEAMTRAQTAINNHRDRKDVPLELLEELESSSRSYWTTVLTVEAEHVPELKQYVDAKIDRYMKDVTRTLQQYWQWRARKA